MMLIPLADLERVSEIAKERYLTMKPYKAFPFSYALPVPLIGETDRAYQEVLVDYRHDIGVHINLKEQE